MLRLSSWIKSLSQKDNKQLEVCWERKYFDNVSTKLYLIFYHSIIFFFIFHFSFASKTNDKEF